MCCCLQFAILVLAAILHSVVLNPVVTTAPETDDGCRVQNRLIQYTLNDHVRMINIPECVVNTAYVIRSTITSDPEDVAHFVETNRRCCCEIVKYTRRQIRIGHTLHKYNEIESCACRACSPPLASAEAAD